MNVRLWKTAARLLVSGFFLIGGVMHFARTDLFLSIMPPYVPFPLEVVWFTGVCEIAGAIGLWPLMTRRWAGLGLMALSVAVLPANVQMALHPEDFLQFPAWLLWVRLPLQVVPVGLAWWCRE